MASGGRNSVQHVFPIPPNYSLDDPDDIRAAAELAYVWGWTLVNVATRAKRMKRFANEKPLFVDGWPIGYNAFTLQTKPSSARERLMCCPNTSLRYGGGAFALGTKGAIIQVPPELVARGSFWLYSLYDARSGQFAAVGKQHASEPGFYLIVGPKWDQSNPDTVRIPDSHIIYCATDLAFLTARIFIDPQAHPDWLRSVNAYPSGKYEPNVYQSVDWESVTDVSCPGPTPRKELRYVHPLTFFDELPGIMDGIEPQVGEEDLYRYVRALLARASASWRVMLICRAVARETERTIIESYMLWRNNGIAAGNGWFRSVDSGQWTPTEYVYRTATAKSNLFQNRPADTLYYCTDTESNGLRLNGRNTYKITFAGGKPPANGPWSVTVYNQYHFLYEEPYSFSDRDLRPASGDPLVVYAGPEPPFHDCYFIRTPPNEPFCLYLRAYGMDESALPGPWIPPKVEKVTVL
jgi:hypothetical protein